MEKSLRTSAAVNFDEGNLDMAVKRYEQLEDYTGSNQNIIISLTGQLRSNYRLKRLDKTIEIATKIANLAYADAELKTEADYYFSKTYYDKQQFDQAIAYLTKVMKNNKAILGAEASYLYAEILYNQDKNTESEDIIYDINEKYASYTYWRAKAFILLADIYSRKGDYFTAKNTLQSIIENYQGDDIKKIAEDKLETFKKLENESTTKKANENE